MASRHTPKLPEQNWASHTKGSPQGYTGPCPEVLHQDEPTPAHPISAHKQMAGHSHPGHIGKHKG